MALLSFVVLALSLLAVYHIYNTYFRLQPDVDSDVNILPGPSSSFASWIWGHELLVFKHDATQMYSVWNNVCGPFYKIKAALFHPDVIIVADHAAAHHIFADTENYVKSPAFRPPIMNLLGRGMVWAEGDEHKLQRKIFSPAFSQESIKLMAAEISECAEKYESRVTNHILANNGRATINIVDYTSAATLDVIGRVGFGHDFKAQNSHKEPLDTLSDADAIRHAWDHLVETGLQPASFIAPIVVRAYPPITKAPLPLMRAQGETKTVVKRLAGRILEREKEMMASGITPKGRDILSIMMRARSEAKGDSPGLDDDLILDSISTFTMVGHETTACAINMTIMQLARHPAIQSRLREEVLTKGRDLGYDDIQKLEFLDAVVKEGLRLHPPSPQTERVALRDDVIPLSAPIKGTDGKMINLVRIKKDQVFLIPFTTINTSPAVWGPEAGIFNPDRWLVPGGIPSPSELPSGWSGLVTFCDGPRNCIGWRLAVFEFKVILATLIRTLEFHDTKAVVLQRISPTLQPVVDGKGGFLPIHVTLAGTA